MTSEKRESCNGRVAIDQKRYGVKQITWLGPTTAESPGHQDTAECREDIEMKARSSSRGPLSRPWLESASPSEAGRVEHLSRQHQAGVSGRSSPGKGSYSPRTAMRGFRKWHDLQHGVTERHCEKRRNSRRAGSINRQNIWSKSAILTSLSA